MKKTKLKDKLQKKARKKATRPKGEPTPLRNAKRSKSARKSKRKGGTHERKIAKLFAEWSGCLVKRTPMSGGWAAAQGFGVKGDLVFKPRLRFHVECKDRKGWRMDDILTGIRSSGELSINDWWTQTVSTCPPKRVPMLVFHGNARGCPDFLMMRTSDWYKYGGRYAAALDVEFLPHFKASVRDEAVVIMVLEHFFAKFRPPKKAPFHKSWTVRSINDHKNKGEE